MPPTAPDMVYAAKVTFSTTLQMTEAEFDGAAQASYKASLAVCHRVALRMRAGVYHRTSPLLTLTAPL